MRKKNSNNDVKMVVSIIIAIIAMFVIGTLTSCKSATDIVYVHDTIATNHTNYEYIHDSVYIDRNHIVYQKGDTIYVQDSIYVYKYLVTHDTTTDTMIQTQIEKVPYEVVKEKKVHGFLWWVGLLAIICLIAFPILLYFGIIDVSRD